ncbi:DUF3102 domain-containing protein [Bosea thiooxidans]
MLSNERPPETKISAAELQESAQKIKALRHAATEHAIEIGRELLRIKEKLPHGVFVKWVERACEFKIRTAQDLMKLARETEIDAKLVALMVPSTLRVYLSKKTPSAVRDTILKRLENGERVSRSDLYSRVSETRTKAKAETTEHPLQEGFSSTFFTSGLHGNGGERRGNAGGDRARMVAELLLRHLSPKDYELIMEEINWEVWNRVFVWMRAARIVDSERVELAAPNTPAPQPAEVLSAKLQ